MAKTSQWSNFSSFSFQNSVSLKVVSLMNWTEICDFKWYFTIKSHGCSIGTFVMPPSSMSPLQKRLVLIFFGLKPYVKKCLVIQTRFLAYYLIHFGSIFSLLTFFFVKSTRNCFSQSKISFLSAAPIIQENFSLRPMLISLMISDLDSFIISSSTSNLAYSIWVSFKTIDSQPLSTIQPIFWSRPEVTLSTAETTVPLALFIMSYMALVLIDTDGNEKFICKTRPFIWGF